MRSVCGSKTVNLTCRHRVFSASVCVCVCSTFFSCAFSGFSFTAAYFAHIFRSVDVPLHRFCPVAFACRRCRCLYVCCVIFAAQQKSLLCNHVISACACVFVWVRWICHAEKYFTCVVCLYVCGCVHVSLVFHCVHQSVLHLIILSPSQQNICYNSLACSLSSNSSDHFMFFRVFFVFFLFSFCHNKTGKLYWL